MNLEYCPTPKGFFLFDLLVNNLPFQADGPIDVKHFRIACKTFRPFLGGTGTRDCEPQAGERFIEVSLATGSSL